MKLFLLVLAAFVGYSECQQCQCGLFAGAPADTQGIPLEYVNRASGQACDAASAAGCQAECQAVGDDRDRRAYCEKHREYGNHRCIGGYWCERLYNLNVGDGDVNSTVSVYYRLNGCDDDSWGDAGYTFEERLCCSDGYFDQCEGECTDCARENLCEGGVFIQDQFDVIEGSGINPIPLETLAETTGQNCTVGPGWPDLENGDHDCDKRLTRVGGTFFDNLDLSAIVDGTSYTFGQQYCSALFYRWGDLARGVYNKELLVRGRMPDCEEDEDRFLWNQDVVYATGDANQLLCCDDDANYCDCNDSECVPI